VNILVTGGAGYIGSIAVEQLVNHGHHTIVIDNLQAGNRAAIHSEAVFYQGSFGDIPTLTAIFQNHQIDAVIHLAAEGSVGDSMTNPSIFFTNNVAYSINLLNEMCKHGCSRFIFSSSAAIFGEPQYTPVDEAHPKKPVNAYGESKLMFEKILDWYHRAYGLKFNAFRYFNAAGASVALGAHRQQETRLIPIAIEVALGKREYINIYGTDYPTKDGTCIRDYIHVLDLAHAHILALENLDKHPNGKYNLGNGHGFSVREVIETVGKVSERKISWVAAPRRMGDPAVLVASSELAQKELGLQPRFDSLEQIIRSAWEWRCKHPDGFDMLPTMNGEAPR
jgi:UDP-glucose 4-epimerase